MENEEELHYFTHVYTPRIPSSIQEVRVTYKRVEQAENEDVENAVASAMIMNLFDCRVEHGAIVPEGGKKE